MRTPSEPSPGLELAGSVRLIEKLGEGGMGSVWTAQHMTLHTQVAVKFLISHMAQDAAAAARFSREAMAAARIKSPHVVQIFDHGMSSDFGPYIVMELLEGETLSAFVQRHGRLTPGYAALVVTQLCRALAKAHAQGIIHRDIKPDNVFLIDAEREVFVKVLDFGIAKNLRDELSVTSTGAMMGTPHYMSPEQMLSSKHVDLRTDLWAVAVLAYHCLLGKVPFDGETFGAVAIAVTNGQFPPVYATYGIGSPALDAWFARALDRDLNARFRSADELSDAFARASGGSAASPRVTGSGQLPAQAATWGTSPAQALPTFNGVVNTVAGSPHRQLYAVAAGTTLALGAAIAVGAWLLKGHEPAPPPIAGTVSAVTAPSATASPTTAVSAVASAPGTNPAAAPPPTPPTLTAAAPAISTVGQHKPKTLPRTTATPPPPQSHPDRGF
jgi:serine/threonine-protein kinase